MNRLPVRLVVTFLLLNWLAIGVIAVVLRNSIEGGFRDYVSGQEVASVPEFLPEALETYYAEQGTWQGAESQFSGAGRSGSGGNSSGQHGNNAQGRQYFVLDLTRHIVASADPAMLGDTFDPDTLQDAIALSMDGQPVGWLTWQTPGQQRFGAAEQSFLDDMTTALIAVGVGVGFLTLAVGIGLAWQLTRPLGHLRAAVHELSEGQRGRQVTLEGTVEIRAVATAFNRMSSALARSEQSRQRMAADVAHELRTPVTVISSHLEGMLDNVLPNSKEQIAIAYDQTLHLKRLIEDLRLLTLAEIRQLPLEKQAINITAFLNGVYLAFEPLALDQNIQLALDCPTDLPPLHADAGRLRQVIGNLMTNALRHTPAEGHITLSAKSLGQHLILSVTNTGVTLSEEDAAHLFDPFWRADDARDRDRGGSGLGLAIARQLIELHGGTIAVKRETGSTTFEMMLPEINETPPQARE